MKFTFLLIILVPSLSFAEYVCPGITRAPVSSLFDLPTSGKLDWWSATPDQVQNAPCKKQTPPTDQEMLAALQPSPLSKRSETINGISFKDEDPELLQLFRDLNTFDSSKTGSAALSFKSSCSKVLCAAQEIYGKREGIQILYMLKRFGFNGSHLRTAQASLWKAAELEDILTALSDYPDELYPLDYNRKLVHYTRGARMKIPEGESVANSTMEIYDMWNELTRAERQQSLLHELGHVVARKDDVDDSAAWYKVAGWKDKTRVEKGKTIHGSELIDASKAVSQYGMTNPHEDFAESVVAYRFNGALMKDKYPEKYAFLKERVFDGKEYLTKEACLTSKSHTEQKKEAALELYNKVLPTAKKKIASFDGKMTEKAQIQCLQTIIKGMTGDSGSSQNCTSRALQRLQLEKASKGKIDGSLLSDDQLNALTMDPDTEKEFNQAVLSRFSKDVMKSLPSDERNPQDSGLFKSAPSADKGCTQWSLFAQSQFTNGTVSQPVVDQDKYYFFTDRRYERVANFFRRACMTSVNDQSAGRLDLAITKNLP